MTMSDSDMNALKSASGLEASTLFLTQMTTHHNGAIDMAKSKKLATKIIAAQTGEIATMSDILTSL